MAKPTAALCTTLGPFNTRAGRWLNRCVLSRADLVIPRDRTSYEAALALGLDRGKVVYFPDIVFTYRRPSEERARRMARQVDIVDDHRFAVVTLSKNKAHTSEDDYRKHVDTLQKVLGKLLTNKTIQQVLVTVHAAEDYQISQEFVARMNDQRIRLVEPGYAPEELMALYRRAEVLIARRMHSAIFALVGGTPVVAFTMGGNKVEGVLGSIGLDDMLMSFPLVDIDGIVRKIQGYIWNRERETARVVAAVDNARERLVELPLYIRRCLTRSGPTSRRTGR